MAKTIEEIIKEVMSEYGGKTYHCILSPPDGKHRMSEERRRNGRIMYDTFGAMQEVKGDSKEMDNTITDNKPKFTDKQKNNYDIATKILVNGDTYAQRIGLLIYISFYTEQEAFTNGLYAYMVNNLDKDWESVYKNSEFYRWVNYVKKSLDIIKRKGWRDIVNKILSEHGIMGIDYDALVNMADNTYRKLIKQAGRIITLIDDRFGLKRDNIEY